MFQKQWKKDQIKLTFVTVVLDYLLDVEVVVDYLLDVEILAAENKMTGTQTTEQKTVQSNHVHQWR